MIRRTRAKKELEDLLLSLHSVRMQLQKRRGATDALGIERIERAQRILYAQIRDHCTRNGLRRPADVPESD